MRRSVYAIALGGLAALALGAAPTRLAGQELPLPKPRRFVDNLDVRCYKIPDQPPLGFRLRLDHLNPVLKDVPSEPALMREPQELCVPVYKEKNVPPDDVLPFIEWVDWKCYGITGRRLNLPLRLTHLNPIIAEKFGSTDAVTVQEPQQLCVPVLKRDPEAEIAGAPSPKPPPEVLRLVQYLDVKCYRIDSDRHIGGEPIQLTHLNPLFRGIEPEIATFLGPAPIQLCVPVAKNGDVPPDDVLQLAQFSDVLCYGIKGRPLNRQLVLQHLDPVLIANRLPDENVFVADTTKLCVPVAKNDVLPPGEP